MSAFLSSLAILILASHCIALPVNKDYKHKSKENQQSYLKNFGYLDEDTPGSDGEEKLKNALKRFQEVWDIPATGEADDQTLGLMDRDRCGVADTTLAKSKGHGRSRQRRYIAKLEEKWQKTGLTYRIFNYPNLQISATEVDKIIHNALQEWANVTPLRFTKVTSVPDIDILFASHTHCKSNSFDGRGGVLAHAFLPHTNYEDYAGNVHFDDSEIWRVGYEANTVDLFQVAVHEFGHSLGLRHSNITSAIMAPFYSYSPSWKLNQDDIDGIQFLYGSSASTKSPSVTPSTTVIPVQITLNPSTLFCNNDPIDAISTDARQRLFAFKGPYFSVVDDNGNVTPRLIQSVYPELPETIDAAVYVPTLYRRSCYGNEGFYYCEYELAEQAAFYVFKGEYYYEYSSGIFDKNNYQGRGKITTKFGAGIKSDLDSVFSIYGISLHFTKGNEVWRTTRAKSSPSVDNLYPMPLSDLVSGLPNTGVHAAYNGLDNVLVYFFTGNQYYTSFASGSSVTVSGSPSHVSEDLFNCYSANNLVNNDKKKNNGAENTRRLRGRSPQNSCSEDVYMDENGNFVKRQKKKHQCTNDSS